MRSDMIRIGVVGVLLVAACGTDTAGTDASGPAATEFAGGDFQLYVRGVTDGCLDGGLQALFMPDGNDQPYALRNVSLIPALADLPKTYVLKLEAPFAGMDITARAAGEGNIELVDGKQDDVVLTLPGSEDCTADMTLSGLVRPQTDGTVVLAVTVVVDDLKSPTETCPVLDAVPCQVVLDMTGTPAM